MENAIEELGMGAAAMGAAAALALVLILTNTYGRLLASVEEKLQQNPVVVESSYE